MRNIHRTGARLGREIARETREVEAAIALVRSGVATAVSIANLRHGEEIVERLREQGVERDVRLEPRPLAEDAGLDLDVLLISA